MQKTGEKGISDTIPVPLFVPPVEQSAGGILMPPHSSFHDIQQESSSEGSAEAYRTKSVGKNRCNRCVFGGFLV